MHEEALWFRLLQQSEGSVGIYFSGLEYHNAQVFVINVDDMVSNLAY